MQRFRDVVTRGSGQVVAAAAVTVRDADGNLATLYADDGVTPKANPLTSDENGEFSFYAANGVYSLVISKTGITTKTVSGVLLEDITSSTGTATMGQVQSGPMASWVAGPSSGIYSYLESNARENVRAKPDGIGIFAAARSSPGGGSPSAANIAIAAFGHNDKTTGSAGVWGMYSTVLRNAGVAGVTHALEVDVANAGTTVPIYPAAMFPPGMTAGMWLGSGGESTATSGLVGDSSCAIGVISNDPAFAAQFDKGIVFHNKSIVGADGTGSMGCAIAYGAGHQQIWFNNSNQATGEVVSTNANAAVAQRLDLSAFGTIVYERATGAAQFQVDAVANPTAYPKVAAGTTVVTYAASGSGNVDLLLSPLGSGTVRFGTLTANADAPVTGYMTIKDAGGTTRKLAVIA